MKEDLITGTQEEQPIIPITPISSNVQLSSPNNSGLSSKKKSNLRKCSKYDEMSPNGSPFDPNPTPRKRIRILENLDAFNQNNHIPLNLDLLEDEDALAEVETKIYRVSSSTLLHKT